MARITTQDLLLSGWHGICTGGKQFWSHPQLCPVLVLFRQAAKVERKFKDKWIFESTTVVTKGNESKGNP